ncbi:MAG: DivIVA domain-containing protein [Nocardioidaceae bacterium]
MTWFIVIAIVLVAGGAVVVGVGAGAPMAAVHDDRPDVLPFDRPLVASDLDDVRFTTTVRGYRMDEVDALLLRLRAEWSERAAPLPPDLADPAPTETDRAG